jgi:prophage regulatory protein
MKRGNQLTGAARASVIEGSGAITATTTTDITVNERAIGVDGAGAAKFREQARKTEPLGAFDTHAVRDLYKAAPVDPKGLRRTIRRAELRQIVPLADSTIYELERRGEFPRRFFLTARCVVWDLAEVIAWLQGRRQTGNNGVKMAPMPDVRQRTYRPISAKG